MLIIVPILNQIRCPDAILMCAKFEGNPIALWAVFANMWKEEKIKENEQLFEDSCQRDGWHDLLQIRYTYSHLDMLAPAQQIKVCSDKKSHSYEQP